MDTNSDEEVLTEDKINELLKQFEEEEDELNDTKEEEDEW